MLIALLIPSRYAGSRRLDWVAAKEAAAATSKIARAAPSPLQDSLPISQAQVIESVLAQVIDLTGRVIALEEHLTVKTGFITGLDIPNRSYGQEQELLKQEYSPSAGVAKALPTPASMMAPKAKASEDFFAGFGL